MDFAVDASELTALASDFTRRGLTVGPKVLAVTTKAALNVKTEAVRNATGMRALPHLAASISYDVTVEGASIVAEIGPEARGQGNLGHILEYGSATLAPHPFMAPAFDREVPNWMKHLRQVGD